MQIELNDEQTLAVKLLEGPVLVLAGAGSGKTRVVTERIVRLIESGIHPSAVLGLTFTNKAAKEMQERVEKLSSHRVWISTFHRLGAKVLRESIEALGYQKNFLILDEEDADKVVKACLEKLGIEESKAERRKLRSLISKSKNSPLSSSAPELPHGLPLLYAEELKRMNALDFDDLLLLPLKLFEEHPAILDIYRARYTHLLVDEYQDTNALQDRLIYLLAGSRQNLFVVGDPDQAIYSWRGANIQNILNFEKSYPGCRVIRLEQNYRSQSHILEAANALIAKNGARYDKVLKGTRPSTHKLKLIRARNEKQEAFRVTEKISERRLSGVPYREIAVLYRTNAQSRPFEDQLLARGIPYVVVGGVSFYQRKEIKDILCLLRLVLCDNDRLAFERVMLLKKGLGKASLKKLLEASKEEPLYPYCQRLVEGKGELKLASKALASLKQCVELVERLRSASKEMGVSALVRMAIDEFGYIDLLREDPETFQDRRENVEALVAKALEWDREQGGSLLAFFEELSLKSNLDEADADSERVSLMTIHNSKGLEFELTFLAGMEEDLFPHVNSREDDSALEEERRLCYVAMTRAKEELVLSTCSERFLFGFYRSQIPSRFLHEIPSHFLEQQGGRRG